MNTDHKGNDMNTATTYRDALATLNAEELDVMVEALEAYRVNLTKQVREADDRAIARGARARTYGGYVGQHDSTQAKREAINMARAAQDAAQAAATEAWCEYGARILRGEG
jgi:hypothetical protein